MAPVEDEHEVFRHNFGDTASIVLVRPDSYITLIGTDKSVADIAKFL